MTIPLLVDTDSAFDDWLALAYLVQSPRVELKAVTHAATGEAHAKAGVATALGILGLRDIDVPVTSGREKPLKGDHCFPLFVRLVMDFRLGIALPKTKFVRAPQDSKSLLADMIRFAPEKVTLLTLAPLTNIAEVLIAYPELVDKIEMIYIMGGALHVPGNLAEMLPKTKNHFAEWNIYVDYYAADVVLRSGAPVTLIPLDATYQVPLTDSFYARLIYKPRTPAADFVMRVVKRLKTLSGKRTLYLWDLAAAAIATHPETAQFEMRHLRVEQTDAVTIGRVVEDPAGSPVRVCTSVDQTALELIVLNTLNGYEVEPKRVVGEYQTIP